MARKYASYVFAGLSAALAVVIIVLCVFCRNASPMVLGGLEQANRQVSAMFTSLKTRDAAQVATYFAEGTDLERMYSMDSPVAKALTEKVWDSLTYEINGKAYGAESALAVDVTVRAMDAGKTLESAKSQVRPLVNEKVKQTQNLDAILGEDGQYSEDFLNEVMLEALLDAMRSPEMREQTLTVYVRKTNGKWEILPEDSLINALSGWMKE